MYADIPLPVLQVTAGEEGEPGGFPNFLKEEENYEKEEEMEGKRRDEEDM